MLIATIKDLEMRLGNLNLYLGKSALWFELLAQKEETGKQMTDILYY